MTTAFTPPRPESLFLTALKLSPLFFLAIQALSINTTGFTTSITSTVYEAGILGSYPLGSLPSAPTLVSPYFNFPLRNDACHARSRGDDAKYIFVAPRGWATSPRPMIFDEDGRLVWSGTDATINAYDLKVQQYLGNPVITYWTGDDEVRGHGSGEYHILDQNYSVIRCVTPGNGFEGDLHDFIITEDNTALMTIYQQVDADLSSVGGPVDGKIWDSLFQELDLATDEVVFQWRASDHINFGQTFRSLGGDGTGDDHWDWFHINSIEKDVWGNYLISSRYTHSLMYIDGGDGHVIWNLGGKLSDFVDLSDGRASTFAGQHDARWHNNYTIMTLFDNGADYDTHTATHSRGVRLAVDTRNMTVELLQEFIDPGKTLSVSQGSVQELSNGNVLIGYGFNAFMTEFDAEGKPLCDMHLMPGAFEDSGDVQSYRAFKDTWQGFPAWPPSLAFADGKAYMSWNGATEVDKWMLEAGDADLDPSEYRNIITVQKDGFETSVTLRRGQVNEGWVRAVALGADGEVLGETEPVEFDEDEVLDTSGWGTTTYVLPAGLAMTVLTVRFVAKRLRTWRNPRHEYAPIPPQDIP